jgi:hypothetical protein
MLTNLLEELEMPTRTDGYHHEPRNNPALIRVANTDPHKRSSWLAVVLLAALAASGMVACDRNYPSVFDKASGMKKSRTQGVSAAKNKSIVQYKPEHPTP